MFKEVPLDVSVGEGWKALKAQLPDAFSSIVLLTFSHQAVAGPLFSRPAEERHVRLDIDKKMIIDAPPAVIEPHAVDEIVGRLADARREAA